MRNDENADSARQMVMVSYMIVHMKTMKGQPSDEDCIYNVLEN